MYGNLLKLAHLAEELDQNGFYAESDAVTELMSKVAQTVENDPVVDVRNMPKPFQGSEEEKKANYLSHHFDNESRCMGCDCRPWGESCFYPCGLDERIPRITRVTYQSGKVEDIDEEFGNFISKS